MLTGTVPVVELPELKTPLVTSGVNWIYIQTPYQSNCHQIFEHFLRNDQNAQSCPLHCLLHRGTTGMIGVDLSVVLSQTLSTQSAAAGPPLM